MTESLFYLGDLKMNVEFKLREGCMRILLKGEIDHHTAKDICKASDMHIMNERPHTVLLDFSFVTFMDSSGLAVVVGRKRLCEKTGAKIYIVNISGHPEKILRMAGADRLIEFAEDSDEE